MALIVGASQYLSAATLANKKGTSPVVTNMLGGRGAVDLLDVARRVTADNGIGLSSAARQLNKQFLNSTQASYNAIFGLGMSQNSTIQSLIQKINAIRASLPENQIREDLRGVVMDSEGNVVSGTLASDSGAAAARSTGTTVNTTA